MAFVSRNWTRQAKKWYEDRKGKSRCCTRYMTKKNFWGKKESREHVPCLLWPSSSQILKGSRCFYFPLETTWGVWSAFNSLPRAADRGIATFWLLLLLTAHMIWSQLWNCLIPDNTFVCSCVNRTKLQPWAKNLSNSLSFFFSSSFFYGRPWPSDSGGSQ